MSRLRRRSRLAWDPRLEGAAARGIRTVQELLVVRLLEEEGYSFREQWALKSEGQRLIFDFLVEGRVLLECSQSDSKCYRAWETLRRKAVIMDWKFSLALKKANFTTVALLEAPRCPQPMQIESIKPLLPNTRRIALSLEELASLLHETLRLEGAVAAQPAWSGVEDWLKTDKRKAAKEKGGKGRARARYASGNPK